MTTPEEFCKERGFNGKGSDMTENCLMWAMMRQYAEYYSKYLASDGVSADVSGILQKERVRIFNQLLIEEQETAFSRKVEVDTDDLYNVIFKNGTIEP